MSMLLMIYSLGNLDNVSWGTRETKAAVTPQTQQAKPPPKTGMMAEWLEKLGANMGSGTEDGNVSCSCGNLFR